MAAQTALTSTSGTQSPAGGRVDALLFIESKGNINQVLLDPQRTARDGTPGYHGWY